MNPREGDVRRHAWTRGQALWRMGMPVAGLLEDARGAADEGQSGLLQHTARNLGATCSVVLALVLVEARPIPAVRAQPGWALARIAGHPLAAACERLIRVDPRVSDADLLAACEALVASVEAIVGKTPSPMDPDGYFPSLARAREWLTLAETVGEEGFLPEEWTGAL